MKKINVDSGKLLGILSVGIGVVSVVVNALSEKSKKDEIIEKAAEKAAEKLSSKN
jgi:hypothetical protein